jgi:threonine dehydratase
MSLVTVADILAAHQVTRPHVWHTPLAQSAELSQIAGGEVYLKLECWQRTGSFKVRGALNRIAALSPVERARGVVTASAGNHGLGVAYAGRVFGLADVVVFVPENAATAKVNRLEATGCQVHRAGADYDAAHRLAETYAREQGAVYVSAYDDPFVIAGQGTVGLEILADLAHADVILVPVGGGGLIAGIAVVAKALHPSMRVLGVQPVASPAAYLSLRDGRAYESYPAAPTVCDGLAGGFGRVPFAIAKNTIDDVLLVPEADIRRAMGWLLDREQLLVEGSGAIAIAPLLSGQLSAVGQRVVTILTGRNLDASLLRTILAEGAQP